MIRRNYPPPITLAAIRPGTPYFHIVWNYVDERDWPIRRSYTSCVRFHIAKEYLHAN